MMRDCLKNRAGFDRVLMAVAATFLTVSATSALAQADPARTSAAELAIDAAIPRPEPANVPPPTINDFKPEATASVPTRRRQRRRRQRRRPPRPNRPISSPLRLPTPAKTTRAKTTARPPRPRRLRLRQLQRRPQNPPRSRSRPQATSRPQISRSPTDCAKCWVRNRCAFSTARLNEQRWRSFTSRASLRRCGRKAEP